MSHNSYNEIADNIIKEFIKAVVLIDDHWKDAEDIPEISSKGIKLDNSALPPVPLEKEDDIFLDEIDVSSSDKDVLQTDPAYLREIGKEIVKEGFLFTGFQYTDANKKVAVKLAANSDILILDWYLGSTDSRPALDLLSELSHTGTPRFIFILTDQSLESVKEKIKSTFGEIREDSKYVFSCGAFSFALKNKSQAGGGNTVIPSNVLHEAVKGIKNRFGGLMQLAALELLGQYRSCLHEVLEQFAADTDLPFILEWLEENSPIRDNHSFASLAIDEWTSRVKRRYQPGTAQVMKDDTVSAFLNELQKNKTLPDGYEAHLQKSIEKEKKSFPSDHAKKKELVSSLEHWMCSSGGSWPKNLKGLKKGDTWPISTKRLLAMNYLSLIKGIGSPKDTLMDLDVIFQCQANLPAILDQGTILLAPKDTYLICITPTCDCCRPSRINHNYVFLQAEEINLDNLNKFSENVVIAIRKQLGGNQLLAVNPKPTFTYNILNPSLNEDLKALATLGGGKDFALKPIAQLRPSRVQSLVALAAGRAIEVGLDRSELLRQLCKNN